MAIGLEKETAIQIVDPYEGNSRLLVTSTDNKTFDLFLTRDPLQVHNVVAWKFRLDLEKSVVASAGGAHDILILALLRGLLERIRF